MTTVTFDEIMAIVAEPEEPTRETFVVDGVVYVKRENAESKVLDFDFLQEMIEDEMFAQCDHVVDGVMVPWFKDHPPMKEQVQVSPPNPGALWYGRDGVRPYSLCK